MSRTLVYIGIPSRQQGFWDAYTGLLGAINFAAAKGIFCAIAPHVGSSLICRARQNITWEFLKQHTQCDYFFQLDDDVQLPPDALVKLIEADKDIIGGMYSLKSKAGKIAIRGLNNETFKVSECPDQVKEVQYISGGCVMQTRKNVQEAWDHYKDLYYTDNSEKYGKGKKIRQRCALYMPYIYKDEYLSEDWAYCQRLIDMGKKIYVHTGVKCVHHGLAAYGIV
jgi:hypothetical protein